MEKRISWERVKWIGPSGVDPAADTGARPCNAIETAMYRLEVSCPVKIGELCLPVHISAAGRYKLYVNGRTVMVGPCRGGRRERYFESVDLATWLCPGINVLAVRVVAYPPYEAQHGNQRAPFCFYGNAAGPMLVMQGQMMNSRKEVLAEVSTGVADWRVSRDDSLRWDTATATIWMGAMEDVDLALEPEGWNNKLSLPAWPAAEAGWAVTPNGYGEIMPFPLSPRPIPLPFFAEGRFVREMPIRASDAEAISFGLPLAELDVDWVDRAVRAAGSAVGNAMGLATAAGGYVTGGAPLSEGGSLHVPPRQKVVVELDAGFLTTAFLRLPMSGGEGSRIRITYAEGYTVPGQGRRPAKKVRDDARNGWIQGVTDVVLASGREQTYEPFLFRTFRFVRLEVETAAEPLSMGLPSYVETGYPLSLQASFDSAQPWTRRIWDMSARTLARCMQETFTDCPYYEQLQYTMDTRLQMLYTYAASGDDRLARKAIADFHASLLPEGMLQSRWPSDLPQVIPGFSLHWIFMLSDHWWQTGSTELFRRYRPTVDAVLDWFERKTDGTGLAGNLGYWEYVDWVREWEHRSGVPEAVVHGPSATLNLTLSAALQDAAGLMRLTGRADVAAEYEARSSRIQDAMTKACWSEDKGLYQDGPGLDRYSQHTQVWAVLSGLARGDRARMILDNALRESSVAKCSFPWMYLLFRALEKAGMYSKTESLWDLWKTLLPQRLTTVPEIPFDTRSDCHAWGALPLVEFPRMALGVEPAEAGWKRIRICPRMLFLGQASGRAVTPEGIVGVSWQVENGAFRMSVCLPAGAEAKVCLPDGSDHQVVGRDGEAYRFVCPL